MVEAETDFEKDIVTACKKLGELLIEKNRKYKNSYKDSRSDTLELFGSDKIPFYMHSIEKIKRYTSTDDVEDSVMDLAGYCILEMICRKETKEMPLEMRLVDSGVVDTD